MTTLGEALKAAREAKGWTLRQAEQETGVANAHLSQVETGAIACPSASLVLALCGPYGLDPLATVLLAGHDVIANVIGNSAASTARIAALEAALGEALAAFPSPAIAGGAGDTRSRWVPAAQVQAWRDTLAGES